MELHQFFPMFAVLLLAARFLFEVAGNRWMVSPLIIPVPFTGASDARTAG